ncbi:unnamed protein product, partial [Prorocentrum cordatum]
MHSQRVQVTTWRCEHSVGARWHCGSCDVWDLAKHRRCATAGCKGFFGPAQAQQRQPGGRWRNGPPKPQLGQWLGAPNAPKGQDKPPWRSGGGRGGGGDDSTAPPQQVSAEELAIYAGLPAETWELFRTKFSRSVQDKVTNMRRAKDSGLEMVAVGSDVSQQVDKLSKQLVQARTNVSNDTEHAAKALQILADSKDKVAKLEQELRDARAKAAQVFAGPAHASMSALEEAVTKISAEASGKTVEQDPERKRLAESIALGTQQKSGSGWRLFPSSPARHGFDSSAQSMETHQSPAQAVAAAAQLCKLGWHALVRAADGAEAAGCHGHGGLIQLAPRHWGMAPFERVGIDSGGLVPGRLSVVHHAGLVPGGFAWFNVHLVCGDGMSAASVALLDILTKVATTLGKPFVISNDFNFSPADAQQSKLVHQLQVCVLAPSIGTCRPSDGILDYFVVSPCFAKAKITTLLDWPICPHRPVLIEIDCVGEPPMMQVMPTPWCLPRPLPRGCCSRDHDPAWLQARVDIDQAETMHAAWKAFIMQAEANVLDARGLDGEADSRGGRHLQPRLRWQRVALPSPLTSNGRWPVKEGSEHSADCSDSKRSLRWALQIVGGFFGLVQRRAELAISAMGAMLADLSAQRDLSRAKAKFGSWVEEQAALGSVALHAITKEPLPWQAGPVAPELRG